MRDYVQSGHNAGPVTIIDNSSTDQSVTYKPLVQCTNEELQTERTYRKQQRGLEYRGITKTGSVGMILGLIATAALYLYKQEIPVPIPPIIYLFIILGCMGGFGALKYQVRKIAIAAHEQALLEIRKLLMERGVE